jgi:hypothetical protein
MKLAAAQNRILLIFVASFLLLLSLVSISYEQKAIYSQDLRDLVLRFLAIYSGNPEIIPGLSRLRGDHLWMSPKPICG